MEKKTEEMEKENREMEFWRNREWNIREIIHLPCL
jgi:hypothetical protein